MVHGLAPFLPGGAQANRPYGMSNRGMPARWASLEYTITLLAQPGIIINGKVGSEKMLCPFAARPDNGEFLTRQEIWVKESEKTFNPVLRENKMKRKWIVLLAAMVIFISAATACAEVTQSDLVVLDVALIRPVGIVSVAIGTALFIVSLPVSIPSGSVGTAANRLVKDSFEYTFIRPVGDFDYELGTWGKEAPPSSENAGSQEK